MFKILPSAPSGRAQALRPDPFLHNLSAVAAPAALEGPGSAPSCVEIPIIRCARWGSTPPSLGFKETGNGVNGTREK